MVEGINLFLVIFLVLANGFFVASEFSLVGVRRSRIASLAASGNKNAQRLLGLVDDLNAYISATQLGITVSSLALGWIGEPAVAHLLEVPLQGLVSDTVLHTISFTIAFSIITFLHIVLGELAPKTLALERTERIALAIAAPMKIFYKVFYFPIRLLDWAGTRTVRLFGLHPSGEHASVYTEDELRNLISISQKSGNLEEEQEQIVKRAFDFPGAQVREAMIPRVSVDALPVEASFEQTKAAFRTLGYSRIPVYRDRMDNVVGVLFRRDLEPYLEDSNGFELERLLHTPLYVPETASLGSVLRVMQANRTHLAIVVDEHGGMEGLVTLEDLLEEIVGEIDDEFDEEARSQIVKQPDGSYLLDGMLAVRDANRQLNLNLPEDSSYTTLAGFLMAQSGRVLSSDDQVEYYALTFHIEGTDRRRIRRVRLIVHEADDETGGLISSALIAGLSAIPFEPALVLACHL
jgi:CBS domain containing-hemolysin-like protein